MTFVYICIESACFPLKAPTLRTRKIILINRSRLTPKSQYWRFWSWTETLRKLFDLPHWNVWCIIICEISEGFGKFLNCKVVLIQHQLAVSCLSGKMAQSCADKASPSAGETHIFSLLYPLQPKHRLGLREQN